jgi:carbonic anhydrase/acetyltransferase-like protein (isoleucine patch superfamily)
MRRISKEEHVQLESQGNHLESWDSFFIGREVDLRLIRNCRFFGTVKIDQLTSMSKEIQGLKLPIGIYDSVILNCSFGSQPLVYRSGPISNIRFGKSVTLINCGTISIDQTFRFTKESWKEHPLIIEAVNESGSRQFHPFPGYNENDAFLEFSARQTSKGRLLNHIPAFEIADEALLQDVRQLGNSIIGPGTILSSVTQISDSYIHSTLQSPIRIEDGAIVKSSIIEPGAEIREHSIVDQCHIGQSSRITGHALVRHSVIGCNNYISAGEVISVMTGAFHEQHHRSSFLIASRWAGQSNAAAGAIIGSNHNSRSADGEIHAGRGFWPGLNVSLKHSSSFASYTLIANGRYTREIRQPFPFSLLSGDRVYPAYWFEHNAYALFRNQWKYGKRDRRKNPQTEIITSVIAEDTVSEILHTIDLLKRNELEGYVRKSSLKILQAEQAKDWYRKVLILYSAGETLKYPEEEIGEAPPDPGPWYFTGLRTVHEAELTAPMDNASRNKLRLGLIRAALQEAYDSLSFAKATIKCLEEAQAIYLDLMERILNSRKKDYLDPFRSMMAIDSQQYDRIFPPIEEDEFISDFRTWVENFNKQLQMKLQSLKH